MVDSIVMAVIADLQEEKSSKKYKPAPSSASKTKVANGKKSAKESDCSESGDDDDVKMEVGKSVDSDSDVCQHATFDILIVNQFICLRNTYV